MPLTHLSEDEQLFRDTIRRFAKEQIAPLVRGMDEAACLDKALLRQLFELGLMGIEIPEEYGGNLAGDYRFNAVSAEEMSRVSASVSSCLGIHADVVAPYLRDLCTEEQKQRWLPRFCSGELVTAIAMTEPSGGSDLAALKTTAVREGDDWIVNGSKTFITNGYGADLVVVAARTSPEKKARGITLFALETGMPGFERGRKLDKVGQTESDTAELFFDDVRVPDANRIGAVDEGFIAMMERLPQERIGAAISNIAHASAILEETLEYIRTRQAFGQAIGSFQHNKFLAAELVTQIEVSRAYIDQCVLAFNDNELTATDAAKAKWWSAQVQNDVLDACVQLYGGYGYMNEYRVARAWRDARVTKIWAGSNEIMKELIGRDLGL